jgi:hypothetical protein
MTICYATPGSECYEEELWAVQKKQYAMTFATMTIHSERDGKRDARTCV